MNVQIFLFPLLLFYCSSATHFPPHPSHLHPAFVHVAVIFTLKRHKVREAGGTEGAAAPPDG